MSSNANDGYNEDLCVVCFKNVEIYSIGDCDHPVCYECSTRMRVLCRQNECPICRHDMQKVIFTRTVKPYKDLEQSIGPHPYVDRKFKIVFLTATIQRAYNTLLAHVCPECPGRHAFQTFTSLRDHMRNQHDLSYCQLCVENLMILSHERRCYSRKDLQIHQRTGDPDDRSHRGHPLCKFCDKRYVDNDELYRHLRRDHLFCHFCDADGLDQYYNSYDVLRNHFREKHFLCEEGECIEEKFTPAFRTEIDLKAHRASVHGRQMSKAAAKQARTLELAFTLKPRPRHMEPKRHTRYHNSYSDEEEGAVGGVAVGVDYHQPTNVGSTSSQINTASNDEFPSLGGSSAPLSHQGLHFRKPGVTIRAGNLAVTDEDFPALGPEASASVSLRVNSVSAAERTRGSGPSKPTNLSIRVNHRPSGVVTTVSSSKNSKARDPFPALQNDFPALSSKTSSVQSNVSQWMSTKDTEPKFSAKTKSSQSVPKLSQPKSMKSYHNYDDDFPMQNDFPGLSGNVSSHIVSLASTQWSSGKEPEPKFSVNKSKVSQPPPKPPQPKTFHIEDDFPSLNSRFDASCSFTPEQRPSEPKTSETKTKKENSISIPIDNDWTRSVKGPVSTENISSDSDIGSKKNTKKKKNKSKTKKDTNEPVKPSSAKSINNNNESGKKNRQREEPKSKAKQIKVEEQSRMQDRTGKKDSQEILERKRSELKIASLNGQSQSENTMSRNGVPNLNNNNNNSSSNSKLPPGFKTGAKEKSPAPPGFEVSSSVPPPGFSITLNSVARPSSNGLVFTSSSGQNYSISPGENGGSPRVFSYVSPPHVKQRNTALVAAVTTALQSPAALEEFLQMSALYRQGSLTAEAYYSHCQEAMGTQAFSEIFPELLVLLPDIEKQQDLWKVSERRSEWKLNVCAACGQVVAGPDFKHHHATHSLENHFPSLPNGSPVSAWTKK